MRRTNMGVAVAALATLIGISSAFAAEGPPPAPKSTNGKAVTLLATGIPTPTAIAFGKGNIFVAGFGSEDGKMP